MRQRGIESQITRGRQIADRLRHELNIAESSWAHFEAMNGGTTEARNQFRQAMEGLLASNRGLLAAVVRDAIMALCRIVDNPRKDGFPLIEASKLLDGQELRTALIDRAGARAPRFEEDSNSYPKCEAGLVEAKIALIRSTVPLQWNKKPENTMLYEWRERFEHLRDKVLAHPGNVESIVKPNANEIREGFSLISKLVSASCHIFVGSPLPSNSMGQLIDRANCFWNYAQTGFVDAADRDNHARRAIKA
jgi:hypothetical protein